MSLKAILFFFLAHHLSRHKATGKMRCQSGDCIWSPISLRGLFGYVWVNILYYLCMFETREGKEQCSEKVLTAIIHFELVIPVMSFDPSLKNVIL